MYVVCGARVISPCNHAVYKLPSSPLLHSCTFWTDSRSTRTLPVTTHCIRLLVPVPASRSRPISAVGLEPSAPFFRLLFLGTRGWRQLLLTPEKCLANESDENTGQTVVRPTGIHQKEQKKRYKHLRDPQLPWCGFWSERRRRKENWRVEIREEDKPSRSGVHPPVTSIPGTPVLVPYQD